MIIQDCGEHIYREPVGTGARRKTIFCMHGCGCYKDSHGFGGPDGVNPKGDCPNVPPVKNHKENELQLMLSDPNAHL